MHDFLFIYLFFFIIFAIASKSNKREKDRNRDLKDFFFHLISFLLILKKYIYLYLIGELFFFIFFKVNKQVLTKKYAFPQNYSESI